MPDIHSLAGETVDVKRYSESAFSRILTGTLLPESVSRIIYLDCDTIVTDELTPLWEYSLNGKIMGAVRDSRNYRYSRNLGMAEGCYYINSGVLIIDMERYRASGYEMKMVQGIREYNGMMEFLDNDIICKYMQDEIYYLPLRYNLMTLFQVCTLHEIEILRKPEYTYSEKEYNEAKHHPAVIHFDTSFLVNKRPWISGCNHPNTGLWLKYREMTIYKNRPLRNAKQTWRRKCIAGIVYLFPRFIIIRAVGLIHSIVRPALQRRRLLPCRTDNE